MPFCCQGSDDVVHDGFTEQDHTKPAKAWNEAQFVRFGLIDAARGVTHAETFVAAENESLGGFRRFAVGLPENHGSEPAIDEEVEFFRNSVERD